MKKPIKKPSRAKPVTAKSPVTAVVHQYLLRLFVAGATDRSHHAILRVRELCETLLKGRAKLEVIDIYQQPALARENQIVATPTLIIALPVPLRRFIGNLTNIADLFSVLDTGENSRISLTKLPVKI